ncbi:MAG: hypothetical protein ACHQ1H_04570 [Nitrososphaerales archaeon]
MSDIDVGSAEIAEHHRRREFWIPCSRLCDIETNEIVPTIYRFYSLSVTLHKDLLELMSWFGVDVDDIASEIHVSAPPNSHFINALTNVTSVKMPVRFNGTFDSRNTDNLGRIVEKWGIVPLAYLQQFVGAKYTYGYIGLDDFTMFPILLPGTFLQIDESKFEIVTTGWESEYERPIYFVETRSGFVCCWCDLKGNRLILQSHPLSPVPARVLGFPQDAEIVGQVIGLAMQIGNCKNESVPSQPRPKPAFFPHAFLRTGSDDGEGRRDNTNRTVSS